MEYFITGATGFIGTRLVDRLVEDGHHVTALTRDSANADHLPESVTVIEGDITTKESMREGMEGVDAVYHLAAWYQFGPGPWNADKAERINVDGTRKVLELMDDVDVPKGVYASSFVVYGNTGGEYVDESFRTSNSFPSVYQRTKWRAHYEVAEPMMKDGLPLVLATIGGVYGPGDKDYGGTPRAGFKSILQQDMPIIPKNFVIPWDYIDDVTVNLQRAMEQGEPGEEYIIANDPRSLPEVIEIIEQLTNIPAPRAVPGSLFYWLSQLVSVVELIKEPPEGFESENLEWLSSGGFFVDNSKAKRELGIEHRPLEEGLREYLEWEMAQLDMDAQIEPVATV